jgi:glycine cleavage system regulatory protein
MAWQLADYLDQHGRRARRELIPPPAFWAAAASYADPAGLDSLGEAAENRGLAHDAARLYKRASGYGHAGAGARLVRLLHTLDPGDQRPADWAAAHVSLSNPDAVGSLLKTLREAGATGQVSALASRAAADVSLDNPRVVARLLEVLDEAGAIGQVATLLNRDPAACVSLDDPEAVASLLYALERVGATGQVTTLADRAAAHVSLDNPRAVGTLLYALREVGATGQVTTLADRAAAHVSLDNPGTVGQLLAGLQLAGAIGQVATLLDRDFVTHVSLDDTEAVASLLYELVRRP